MSRHDPYPPQDAVELAARIAPGAPVPWLRLELLALRERPELGDLLDPGRTVARATSATTGCATLALGCVGVGGGLGGLYLAGRTTPRGFFETAPYSGVGAVLVLVLLAVLLSLTVAAVRVWRRPWEGPPAGASGVLGLLAAIGGWIALLSRTPEARRWDAAYGWTWQVTTVACVGLGLALQVLAVRKLATPRARARARAGAGARVRRGRGGASAADRGRPRHPARVERRRSAPRDRPCRRRPRGARGDRRGGRRARADGPARRARPHDGRPGPRVTDRPTSGVSAGPGRPVP